MTNFFSVMKFVPDPLSGECINVAVLVFNEFGLCKFETTNQWNRVRSFWGHDTGPLKDVMKTFLKPDMSLESMMSRLGDVTSSIQLTEPRESSREVDELLEWLADNMLLRRQPTHRPLTKSGVVAETRKSLKAALQSAGDGAARTLRVESGYEIRGLKMPHFTDVSLHNGRALVATRALSFLGASRATLEKDVELCYWALEDIRSTDRQLDLAVIVAPPDGGAMEDEYVAASRLYTEQSIPVIPVDEVQDWANSVVEAASTL